MEVITLLHTTLVLAFIAVTAVLLAVTLTQRARVRDVVMTWPRVSPASAWPVVFVGVIVVLAVYSSNTGGTLPVWIFGGYVMGGVLWFAASVIASAIVVSRHGVVCGFTRRQHTVAWVQVTDYFETSDGRKSVFVFLYRQADGERGRLEVPVPRADMERLRFLVDESLEHRPTESAHRVPGRRATS
ncbi:MAG: hypothetical protein JJ896_04355 [Rhodothermales bacterium]|nr:hypothetical protein [Rhodothermales bacterium]MBO6778864.1 hypothetical protein [Rhodothermales bacterium]